jgi:serine O-acetyltransferase
MSVVSFPEQEPGRLDVDTLVAELRDIRHAWRSANRRHAEVGSRGFPSRDVIERMMDQFAGALFPMRLGPTDVNLGNEDEYVEKALRIALGTLADQVGLELGYSWADDALPRIGREARRIASSFGASLPALRVLLDQDVKAAYAGDPAAHSVDEVLICYPGLLAIIHHRLANRLFRLGAPLVARIISEIANSRTGIDIHPGATIGHSFFIDHGTGVVIGETTIIGDNVRLYQAVTLGARSFPADEEGALKRGLARHPIVEDDVVIYAGATILGRVTIGRGSTIGGNVWLTESVAPGSIVNQAIARHRVSSRVEVGDVAVFPERVP